MCGRCWWDLQLRQKIKIFLSRVSGRGRGGWGQVGVCCRLGQLQRWCWQSRSDPQTLQGAERWSCLGSVSSTECSRQLNGAQGKRSTPGRQDPMGTRASCRVTSWLGNWGPWQHVAALDLLSWAGGKWGINWCPLSWQEAAMTLGGDSSCSAQESPALAGVLPGVCAWGTVASPGRVVPSCCCLS